MRPGDVVRLRNRDRLAIVLAYRPYTSGYPKRDHVECLDDRGEICDERSQDVVQHTGWNVLDTLREGDPR